MKLSINTDKYLCDFKSILVEMIKNKKFKKINFNIEEFRQNFSKLAEVLKRFE